MNLRHEFVVPAPVEQVWSVLLDIPRIAPCVPGAVIEEAGDGAYAGTMRLKLGPMVTSFKGTLTLEEVDEQTRRCVLRAQARDARGQGTTSATISSALTPDPDGTHVEVETELRVTGPLAQFGRGVMQDVAVRLMDDFARCLAAELSAGAAAEPTGDGGSVVVDRGEAREPTRPTVANEAGPADAPQAPAPVGANPDADAAAGVGQQPGTGPRPAQALDVLATSREALLRRVIPAGAALVAAAIAAGAVRRRSRRRRGRR